MSVRRAVRELDGADQGSGRRARGTVVAAGGLCVPSHHRLLLGLTAAGGVAQRLRLMPRSLAHRLSLPRLAVRQQPLRSTGGDVWLFTGCIMDAWQRPAHSATLAVLDALGVGVALPGNGAACCGALHVHAGLRSEARRLAARVMQALPGYAPILVDSAGCGAALKDYCHLVGTPEAERFSERVFDVNEWVAERAGQLPPVCRWVEPYPGRGPRSMPSPACPTRGGSSADRPGEVLRGSGDSRRGALLWGRGRLQPAASGAGICNPRPEARGHPGHGSDRGGERQPRLCSLARGSGSRGPPPYGDRRGGRRLEAPAGALMAGVR